MPIKLLILLLISSVAIADLGPPGSAEANVALAKGTLVRFKPLNDSLVEFYADINMGLRYCNDLTSNDVSVCAGNSTCAEFKKKPIKDKAIYCISEFRRLRGNGDMLHLNNKTFLYEINDAKYSNFASLRNNLIESTNRLEALINDSQAFLKSANEIFGQKYMEALNQEYQLVSAKADLEGTIRGTCIYLKEQGVELETIFLIDSEGADYGMWYRHLNQVKALRLISDSLKSKCPVNFQPANYSEIENKFQSSIDKLNRDQWIKTKCSSLKKDKNYGSVCTTIDPSNPYFISLLSGVLK